ncbi:hypothetical protein CF65_00598 [Aggregatibacter actinomycetemcomitans HK1651]|nr:hypothetical protein CF65_00598 [Aggregatibacter actinomycetemcomitans HK1651]
MILLDFCKILNHFLLEARLSGVNFCCILFFDGQQSAVEFSCVFFIQKTVENHFYRFSFSRNPA